MKTKRRPMPAAEYDALTDRIYREVAPLVNNGSAGTTVFMVTGDFEPTQSMHEARWIMTDSPYDCHLLQVDGIGDAILITKQEDIQ